MDLQSQNSKQNPFIQNTRVPDAQHFTNPCGWWVFSNSLIVQSSVASQVEIQPGFPLSRGWSNQFYEELNLTHLLLQIDIFVIGNIKMDARSYSSVQVFGREKILE